MTPLGEILRALIRRAGPIRFSQFMELALYHPDYGYYRRGRDPFGRAGDYFTAEQIQPVYGLLIARIIRRRYQELGRPAEFTVVELGAGRAEMAEAFSAWSYVAVEAGGMLPPRFTGVVFANEFFDALPVEAVVRRAGRWRLLRVGCKDERFVWVEGEAVEGSLGGYLERYVPLEEEGARAEVPVEALRWLEKIASSLQQGFVLTVDYGYTPAECLRLPAGTLMSYRRHLADPDVLADPGERDITALVPFAALAEHGAGCGLQLVRLERLGRVLLEAGEQDEFAGVLAAGTEAERRRRRLQLKTILFDFGESFRVLEQRRATGPARDA